MNAETVENRTLDELFKVSKSCRNFIFHSKMDLSVSCSFLWSIFTSHFHMFYPHWISFLLTLIFISAFPFKKFNYYYHHYYYCYFNFFFLDRISLCNTVWLSWNLHFRPGWPHTHWDPPASICLPTAGIKSICCYAWHLSILIFSFGLSLLMG